MFQVFQQDADIQAGQTASVDESWTRTALGFRARGRLQFEVGVKAGDYAVF
jgi:hypothetical protein